MAFEKVVPRWEGEIIEPPESKKDQGYLVNDKPPAKWENWLRKGTYEAVKELQDKAQDRTEKGQPNGYADLDETGKVPLEQIDLDTSFFATKQELTDVEDALIAQKADSASYSTYKLNPDSEGIFKEIQYKRKNGTLILKSVLSGGTSPKYTTRTETEYLADGVTVKATRVYTITYTLDKVTSEVLQ